VCLRLDAARALWDNYHTGRLHFIPEMYQQQQVAAWAELLQQQRPSWQLAVDDAGAAAVTATTAVEQAAAAAVAEAAAAVLVTSPDAAHQLQSLDSQRFCVFATKSSRISSWRTRVVLSKNRILSR
jgi:hypothetical protein